MSCKISLALMFVSVLLALSATRSVHSQKILNCLGVMCQSFSMLLKSRTMLMGMR